MTRLALSLAALAAATLGPVGCNSQYTNYPEVPTARGLSENPNSPGCESAMVAAVRYVATRYAPGRLPREAQTPDEAGREMVDFPMTIAAPLGTRRSFYERLARQVGPDVSPLTPETLDGRAPIYYVTRVWLRGVDGQVDVMRPMPEIGPGANGEPVYQTVTVRLKGAMEPWYVVHARAWEPGIDPVPEPYFLPDVERIDQFRYSTNPPPPPEEKAYWEPPTPAETPARPEPTHVSEPPPVDSPPDGGPQIVPASPK